MEDDAIRGLTVIKNGEITWPAPAPKLPAAKPAVAKPAAPAAHGQGGAPASSGKIAALFFAAAVLFLLIGLYAPAAFLGHFTVFVLACFVGYMVVWNVTPALHTPLMAVTNAVSGIIIVGAMLAAGPQELDTGSILGLVAVTLAAVNVFGGFLVTQRMLEMFKKKGK